MKSQDDTAYATDPGKADHSLKQSKRPGGAHARKHHLSSAGSPKLGAGVRVGLGLLTVGDVVRAYVAPLPATHGSTVLPRASFHGRKPYENARRDCTGKGSDSHENASLGGMMKAVVGTRGGFVVSPAATRTGCAVTTRDESRTTSSSGLKYCSEFGRSESSGGVVLSRRFRARDSSFNVSPRLCAAMAQQEQQQEQQTASQSTQPAAPSSPAAPAASAAAPRSTDRNTSASTGTRRVASGGLGDTVPGDGRGMGKGDPARLGVVSRVCNGALVNNGARGTAPKGGKRLGVISPVEHGVSAAAIKLKVKVGKKQKKYRHSSSIPVQRSTWVQGFCSVVLFECFFCCLSLFLSSSLLRVFFSSPCSWLVFFRAATAATAVRYPKSAC